MNLVNISTVVRIIIDTTRRCNLSCWYCHSTSGPKYQGPEIDTIRIPEIFKTAEQLKVFEITITGGEPTLWKGLPSLMEDSHRLKFTQLQLITNATSISTQMVEMLKRTNLSRICVSVDGAEYIHTRNRGSGMYERTISGIGRLREAVDNITVISVLDNFSYLYWPELTEILIKLGVKQHHLAPVCFAGNAMGQYRGLNERQFLEVREQVDRILTSLPDGFSVAFNDSLVNGLQSRYMTLQTFTEQFKGWHIVIRPSGQVNTSVNGWGRSWRTVATIGNVNQVPLSQLLEGYSDKGKAALQNMFSSEEEIRRKFHVHNTTASTVLRDVEDVRSTEAGQEVNISSVQRHCSSSEVDVPVTLGINLEELKTLVASNPDRFRWRREDGFVLLFDTVTFNVCIITEEEAFNLKGAVP